MTCGSATSVLYRRWPLESRVSQTPPRPNSLGPSTLHPGRPAPQPLTGRVPMAPPRNATRKTPGSCAWDLMHVRARDARGRHARRWRMRDTRLQRPAYLWPCHALVPRGQPYPPPHSLFGSTVDAGSLLAQCPPLRPPLAHFGAPLVWCGSGELMRWGAIRHATGGGDARHARRGAV